jgi:hypothetical protein
MVSVDTRAADMRSWAGMSSRKAMRPAHASMTRTEKSARPVGAIPATYAGSLARCCAWKTRVSLGASVANLSPWKTS